MWKLGLWPLNSFSGNICFEFSVLVLCVLEAAYASAVVLIWLQPPFLSYHSRWMLQSLSGRVLLLFTRKRFLFLGREGAVFVTIAELVKDEWRT
jgi:hypothetical protein